MNVKASGSKQGATFNPSQCWEQTCPIEFVLQLLSSKWSVLLLAELLQGSRRTHELLEALPGISTKTLTARLRALEKHGLLKRHVYAEVPPHVEYSLTEKGRSLEPVMMELKQVGERLLEGTTCICPLRA